MQVEVTLKKSIIGRSKKHRAIVNSLGLRKINQSVQLNDTAEIQGMIRKVSYLLTVKEIAHKEGLAAETVKVKVDNEKSVETAEKKAVTKKKETGKKKAEEEVIEKKTAAEEKVSVKEKISEEKKIEKEVVTKKKTEKEKEVTV